MPSITVTRGKWKESNICFHKCLPLSTPTAAPPHRDTVFMNSQFTCSQASRRNGWGAVGRSFQGIPVSPVCVCIYSSRTPRGDRSRASSNWLQTILTTESRTADDGRSETTPRARRDGGTERMCDTGSRWHSPQWDPELLTSLLTTTALKKSIPMATALSKTLWK